MLSYINGEVTEIFENGIVVEAGDIGYEIFTSSYTLARLGVVGKRVRVYTYLQTTEDGLFLYGFYSKEEKNMFLKLITISGVGPKLACQVLSGIELEQLVLAIASEDAKLLSTIKGVGKKTAERIILELKGKVEMTEFASIGSATMSAETSDAILALTSLGFTRADSVRAVTKASETFTKTEDIIQAALKMMNRF